MSKPQFPDHLRPVLLINPPPRHSCPACEKRFHLKEEDGRSWSIGASFYEVGDEALTALTLFVLCIYCKSIVLSFVIGPSVKADDIDPDAADTDEHQQKQKARFEATGDDQALSEIREKLPQVAKNPWPQGTTPNKAEILAAEDHLSKGAQPVSKPASRTIDAPANKPSALDLLKGRR
jgi:hypothetical protein